MRKPLIYVVLAIAGFSFGVAGCGNNKSGGTTTPSTGHSSTNTGTGSIYGSR